MPVLIVVLLLPGSAAGQLQIPDVEQGRLRADRVRYDAKERVFFAEGNVRLTLGTMEVRAPRLRVNQATQIVYASGGVTVSQPDTLLRAAELTYEIRPQIARASGAVRLEHEGTTVTGDRLVAHMKTGEAEVAGRASLVRPPARTPGAGDDAATIAADRMRFRWETNEVDADGSVTVTQPDRTVRAEKLVYSEARDALELTGGVVVDQRSGEALAPEAPDVAEALRSRTVLRCDRALVRLSARDLTADGSIRVEQEGRLATGDHAVYTSRDRLLVVTGGVRMQETDGSWLRADKVVISLADETFEAVGNVETEFSVKRGK
ncbi:MAG TPA: LptA/OstA family protein [bacterium]|nr:LptA/OstA family protein [bacterium]